MGRCDNMRIEEEEEKEEEKILFLGGWEEGLKDFFGQDDDAVALLDEKGVLCMVLPVGTAQQQSTGLFLG